jgi:hypothetical protein
MMAGVEGTGGRLCGLMRLLLRLESQEGSRLLGVLTKNDILAIYSQFIGQAGSLS